MDVLHADLTSDNMSYLSLSASLLERSKSSERIFSPVVMRSRENRRKEGRGEGGEREGDGEKRTVRRGEIDVKINLFTATDYINKQIKST